MSLIVSVAIAAVFVALGRSLNRTAAALVVGVCALPVTFLAVVEVVEDPARAAALDALLAAPDGDDVLLVVALLAALGVAAGLLVAGVGLRRAGVLLTWGAQALQARRSAVKEGPAR